MTDADEETQGIIGQLETVVGKLTDATQAQLLKSITAVVEAQDVDMTFQQAMQAASRCQARLEQEREVYAYFNSVINGNTPLNDISMATAATDHQGRPVIARIPIAEVLAAEIEDEERRAEVVRPFFAVINNYYAKRVTEWVNQVTTYMAIAAARMPTGKS